MRFKLAFMAWPLNSRQREARTGGTKASGVDGRCVQILKNGKTRAKRRSEAVQTFIVSNGWLRLIKAAPRMLPARTSLRELVQDRSAPDAVMTVV